MTQGDVVNCTIGDAKITRILEIPPVRVDPAVMLQTTRDEILSRREWLIPDYADELGNIIVHFQAFVIEAKGKRIMVDPCIGNAKPRSHPLMSMLETDFLEMLAGAGFTRESIDFVLCTHLHVDHCGWNTMLVDGEWVPTFPNARYLFSKEELDFARTGKGDLDGAAVYEDSVRPILEAGLVDLVEPGHCIVEGVQLEATPGHTPGHVSVVIKSLGHEAIIAGDVIHHPIQASLPHVSSNFCWDHAMAGKSRCTMLDRVARKKTMLVAAHFAGPIGVRVIPDGDTWRVTKF